MTVRTGAEALTASLAAHGVDLVWGIPGTHNLEIYAELKPAGIRHVLTRHEQGAAFAADGFARATGRVGVCLTTSGPGVLNAATALAQSWSDSVPVLLVSAGLPLRLPGRGSGYLHETKDLHGAITAIVSYSHRVTSVGEIPSAVAQAFAAMTNGRPRPVHLEVPADVLEERAEVELVVPAIGAVAVPDPRALQAAARRLADAERPAIIAGGGCVDAGAALRSLAELLGAPVVTTFNGKGSLPSSHPLSVATGLHLQSVHDLVADSDAVLVVGSELAAADLWEGPLALEGKLVRIDVDPAGVVANATPEVAVVGDARAALAGLPADGITPGGPERLARASEWRSLAAVDAAAVSERWRWVLDPIAFALGETGIVAGDSAMVCYYGASVALPAHRPRAFLYPTGYGTLGYGLPAGIGAKLGRPDDPVVVLIGDGGVMFTIAELAAAAAARLPLAVVVVDNGGYGEIRDEMLARGDEPLAVDIEAPDFPGLARALGCHGEAVADADTLALALRKALAADRPTVLHARCR